MRKLILLVLFSMSLSAFAQKKEKDLTYFYYELDQDQSFISYLKARKEFDAKKVDFKLPSSAEAVQEIENNEQSILKNEKTRSEERRVGKECRYGWARDQEEKKTAKVE